MQPLLLGVTPATIRSATPSSTVVFYQIAAVLSFSV
jgi:hypothetical protein